MNFRAYVHSAACTIAGHGLAVVWSLYLVMSLEVIDIRVADGTEDDDAERLTVEATESAFRLVEDLDLFDDREQQNQIN